VIILDTTVLVYAVGDDHPLREPCARLLAAHRDGILQATTTVEVIQEFSHVYARRRGRVAAVELAALYADAFPLIETTTNDLRVGLELFAGHAELGAFDAVLAGVAMAHAADALISADRAFGSVAGLRWIDPVSAAAGAPVSRPG
jgi:uncharacterized protein